MECLILQHRLDNELDAIKQTMHINIYNDIHYYFVHVHVLNVQYMYMYMYMSVHFSVRPIMII